MINLTLADADRIEAYCEAATPKPWGYDGVSYTIGPFRHMLRKDGLGMSDQDAAFICEARLDLPRAIATLRRVWKRVDVVEAQVVDLVIAKDEVEKERDALRAALSRLVETSGHMLLKIHPRRSGG